jgi:uncharacterized membrane protein YjgN (DUF898 family)
MADTCPRCGFGEVQTDRCPQCGVVVALYQASLEKMRRGPAAPTTSAAGNAEPSPAAEPAAKPPSPFRMAPPPPPTGPAAIAAPRPAAPAGPRRAIFRGSGSGLFGIHVVNALLVLATLGVYFFWAKARVRHYLWSETEFEGDRFAYHGTGRELFVGFLRAVVFFILPITALNMAPEFVDVPPPLAVAMRIFVSILAAIFIPTAMVGARRYRLSRTSWRGIRFSLRARTREFISQWMNGWILTSMTFGLYYPVFITNQQRFFTNNMWFGSQRFTFEGRGRALFWPWIAMLLLFIPTLGLSWFWFGARRQRYFAEQTRFGAARFRSTVSGGALAWLKISTWVGLIGTLGLAWPWLTVRATRRAYDWLSVEGSLGLETITQQAQAVTATGEGLSGFFDADLGLT